MQNTKMGNNGWPAMELRVALVKRGLTVSELARRMGCHRATLSQAIHHGKFPRVATKAVRLLGVNRATLGCHLSTRQPPS